MAHLVQVVGNANSSTAAEVEVKYTALRGTVRPTDYGSLGIYAIAGTSGTMAAGLAANSRIFSFRYPGTNFVLVKKVLLSVVGGSTAFTAGVGHFDLFSVKFFTVADNAGNTDLTPAAASNTGKLRTSMATTGVVGAGNISISTTAAISGGSFTAAPEPINSINCVFNTASLVIVPAQTPLWDARAAEFPLVLGIDEGFIVQATVPATGTWVFSVDVLWEEVTSY